MQLNHRERRISMLMILDIKKTTDLESKIKTSEVKLELFSPTKMLSKIVGNSMPVLGSTACLVQFKSEKEK